MERWWRGAVLRRWREGRLQRGGAFDGARPKRTKTCTQPEIDRQQPALRRQEPSRSSTLTIGGHVEDNGAPDEAICSARIRIRAVDHERRLAGRLPKAHALVSEALMDVAAQPQPRLL